MDKSKDKPGLAILIGHALAKKGKAKHDPMPEEDEGYESSDDADAHLQEIADDMMDAIHAKDSMALKDLLREAFECLEMESHDEASSSDEY